jgi:hypothetical protein
MLRLSLAAFALFLVLAPTAEAQQERGLAARVAELEAQVAAMETVRVFDGNGRDIGAFVERSGTTKVEVLLSGTGRRILLGSESGNPS